MPRAKKSRAKLTPEERRAKKLANLKPSKKGDPPRNPLGINGSTWMTKVREYLTKPEMDVTQAKNPDAPQVPRYENTLSAIHRQALLGNFSQQQWEMGVLGVNPAQRMSLEGPDGEALPSAAPAAVTLYMPAGANTREAPDLAAKKRKPDRW